VDHTFDLLENGDIKDSSLSRPQLMKAVIDATKEANKIYEHKPVDVLYQFAAGEQSTVQSFCAPI
jgi:hypothetical protein